MALGQEFRMKRENGQTSQEYRNTDPAKRFRKMDNGKFGGFKAGVDNNAWGTGGWAKKRTRKGA